MRRIGVRALNQQTSRVLERVRHGESLEITDRGTPVARLVPVLGRDPGIERAVADGWAVAPSDSSPFPLPPVLGDPARDVAAELSEAREHERW